MQMNGRNGVCRLSVQSMEHSRGDACEGLSRNQRTPGDWLVKEWSGRETISNPIASPGLSHVEESRQRYTHLRVLNKAAFVAQKWSPARAGRQAVMKDARGTISSAVCVVSAVRVQRGRDRARCCCRGRDRAAADGSVGGSVGSALFQDTRSPPELDSAGEMDCRRRSGVVVEGGAHAAAARH